MRRVFWTLITFGAVVALGPLAIVVSLVDGFGGDLARRDRWFEPAPPRQHALARRASATGLLQRDPAA